FYTGQIAAMLGGIDLSWLVGLISTALIYYIFAKKAQLKFSKQLVIDQIK
ncbi:cytosine permease, partial [Acinetobacter lactucae]|nr:cytosine permease [Acinetobacter lactucae]